MTDRLMSIGLGAPSSYPMTIFAAVMSSNCVRLTLSFAEAREM